MLVAVALANDDLGATPLDVLNSLAIAVALAAFVLSGALIVTRQPRNIIGWLLFLPGVVLSTSELASGWLQRLDPPPTEATPVLWLALWFTNWSWVLLIYPIFHLLLTFPDGRLLSPRWRLVVGVEIVMIATMVGLTTFGSELQVLVEDDALWTIPNPIGWLPMDTYDGTFADIWSIGLFTVTSASVLAVILRFRRGSGVERQQLKWPLVAFAFFGLVYGPAAAGAGDVIATLFDLLFGPAIALIPISVAIAVTRYKLYAIDRIVSRGVSWAIVTGVLVAVFAGVVVGLQALLGDLTQGDTIAVAASTLAALTLFQPVRARVQRAVDHRFDRARYDAARTADTFAEHVRDEVNLDRLITALRTSIEDTVRPSAIGVWLPTRGDR
jgi:hypothetical protein